MTDFQLLAEHFFDAYNAKDFDLLESMIVPELDFAHFNRGYALSHRQPLIDGLRLFAAHVAADRRFDVERITVAGNIVVREAWWCGTAKADVPGLVTAGERFRMRLCSVLRFNAAGLVAEWKDYG